MQKNKYEDTVVSHPTAEILPLLSVPLKGLDAHSRFFAIVYKGENINELLLGFLPLSEICLKERISSQGANLLILYFCSTQIVGAR